MRKSLRRDHNHSDAVWDCKSDSDGTMENSSVANTILMDIRAAMHDLLDQQKETNRLLKEIFGVTRKSR